ncbi:MAG: hypothetical protein WBP31_04915 [Chitinophagales bacterium]|jgi:tetratricopeptide (TPR) repeat protein|nr:hypothetical protein [Bacteroidota bacterium]MBL0281092.1 hypothetical protein [Bacteroidota bacterium]MBP9879629.1 hypothetical protein [Chitinophagales bacterium]
MKYNLILVIFIFAINSCNNIDNSKIYYDDTKALNDITNDYRTGNYINCINKSNEYVKLYPKRDVGWQFLGGAYLAIGKDSLAEICIAKALFFNPRNAISLTNYGVVNDRKNKFNLAAEYYDKALKINDTIPEIYSNYLLNRIKVGDYLNAQVYGERAISYSSNFYDVANLCFAYYKNGNFKKSDSLFYQLKLLNFTEIETLGTAIGK